MPSLEFKLHLKRFLSANEPALLLRYKRFIYCRAEIRLTRQVVFHVINSRDYVRQFLKKLIYKQNWAQKQYIKYSHQNLFVIICRLPSAPKYFCNWNITCINVLSLKSTSGATYLEITLTSSNTHISPISLFHQFEKIINDLKNCVSTALINDHDLQSELFF